MSKFGAAILILAFLLGVRGAAREIAAPFQGIDQLVRTARPQPPMSEPEPEMEIPIESPIEPELEPESMATLANDTPKKSEWVQWKDRAIAALPEELRLDSDQRRAIDSLYLSAAGESPDEFVADIISRPPVGGGYEVNGVGFSDTQVLEEFYIPDSETQVTWTAFWADWKARAIAALPEAERNDPNRLKEVDTTLERLSLGTSGPSHQETQWKEIAFEVTFYQQTVQLQAATK